MSPISSSIMDCVCVSSMFAWAVLFSIVGVGERCAVGSWTLLLAVVSLSCALCSVAIIHCEFRLLMYPGLGRS